MRPIAFAAALLCLPSVLPSPSVAGQGHAGPAEVVARVHEAAALLQARGAGAFTVLRDPAARFMWKDTYVFVVNCDADEVMANPAFPDRVGGDIKQHTDYAGWPYGKALCETAAQPGGGWIDYVWLKPGGDEPRRKISYVMSVPGTPWQVGAGIYDDTASLDELRRLTAEAGEEGTPCAGRPGP